MPTSADPPPEAAEDTPVVDAFGAKLIVGAVVDLDRDEAAAARAAWLPLILKMLLSGSERVTGGLMVDASWSEPAVTKSDTAATSLVVGASNAGSETRGDDGEKAVGYPGGTINAIELLDVVAVALDNVAFEKEDVIMESGTSDERRPMAIVPFPSDIKSVLRSRILPPAPQLRRH